MTKIKTALIAIIMIAAYFLLAAILCKSFGQKCSIYGDKNLKKFRDLDSLKNRNFTDTCIDNSITLKQILTYQGNDVNCYNSNQFVPLEGYVVLVKYGGSETCNCHSKNSDDKDIHIELALNPSEKGAKAMVIEINRYTRKDHPELNLANLKKMIGKKVRSWGFMFLDSEHLQNAFTTNPTGTNLWRYTCWEQHPVMKIELLE